MLVRMREDEITDIADPANEPQQKLVTRFVQDAYDFVLKAHNWNAQRKEWKIPIIEGQNIYELPVSSEGASVYSVELKDDCNKKNDMIEVDAPGMARLDECQTGAPYYYAPSRVVNGKLGIEIWPMPVIPKEPDPEPGPGPSDPCPCSCGKFTFEPLECLPGEITGGLYEMADTRPITNGVFLNSDGSQGRVQEWLNGEPSNLLPDVNGRAEVYYNDELHYGFMDLNGGQQRHWTNGQINYEGQPFDTELFDTYEFCALIGHTGNQAATNPALIATPDVRAGLFARDNGAIAFGVGPYLLDADNDTVLSGAGGQIAVERSSPSTIRYQQGNILGGYDYITVNVPPEVLDPNDKYMWISAKVDFGVESLGPANETIPGYDNPSYWGFRYFLKADIYVNGWLAAKDIYGNTNAGYGPNDPRSYIQVFVGQDAQGNEIEPTNLKFGNAQSRNGVKTLSTVPSMTMLKPSSGSNEIFVAYMDHGAGAADLPSTELGKNLKRIDPNHTPSEECDCPEPPPPTSLGDLTERAGPSVVNYLPDYYPVSRNEDFTFAIDFFMESNTKYQNLFTLGGNSDKYYGSIHAYSTNSNGLLINSSVSGTTTDGSQIFRWIPSQNGGVEINGTRRSIVIQKVDRSVTVWLDGNFHVNWEASGASEIEFNVDPFPGAGLVLYSFADGSLITDPADNAIIYGHRFTPGAGVYPMDAQTIVPVYGPSTDAIAATFEETEEPEQPVIPYTGDDLVVNGYGMAPKLVANEDMCEIPEQVVLYYALSLASRERGEVGGMAAAEIFALSKQYLADAIARDIGNSRHEYTWETV
ncbi:MAG: hypothetical protein P8P29_03795 [Flavobacteriaceae bacterium]|nr:hypothetical protein [Flavobacteriaceae bacterium]